MMKSAVLEGGDHCRLSAGRVVRIGEQFAINGRSISLVSGLFLKRSLLVVGKYIATLGVVVLSMDDRFNKPACEVIDLSL